MSSVLLNPGPVNVSPRVRQAAFGGPDLCHREPEYSDLQESIRTLLNEVFGAPARDYAAVLLTGSGTAAVEAMIASGVEPGGRLLVIQNGVYGERIRDMARAHGIAHAVVACRPTERPDLDLVRRKLKAERYDALALVHHETTTGLLNDATAVAALCREFDVRLLLDAVSALGGENFDFETLLPAAVACTANKCIQGLPGISFVLVRRSFLDRMAEYPARTVYLHLPRHYREQERRSTPFTPAIQSAFALRAALEELREETVSRRIARYSHASSIIRNGLTELGFEILVAPPLRSSTLSAVALPTGALTYRRLHDSLKTAGFVIYAGLGNPKDKLFRVATMGAHPEETFQRFVEAVRGLLNR